MIQIETIEVILPKEKELVELNTGLKGDRGVSITDFTLDDDGNAVTTFDNGKTKTSKLTSIASASASAKKAATSESNAKDYADKALASETNAKTSETNTATYADNAKKSEIAAKASETNAKASEKSSKSSEEISSTKAEEASASATSASNSATKASGSELNAAKSAESAEDSYNKTVSIQGNFQVVLDTAKASETAAKESETNAKTSETSSADSANKARTSEINAKASETNAAASASTATAQASNAGKSATAAKASETNAKSSETASATSAANAKTSASNAAMSARNSASSASSSEVSNQNSKKWAESTGSPDGSADTDSTTGKTQSSRSWALYSKAKAQESASSATSASGSASSAASSAASASDSRDKASEYKTSASGSATAAASSASSASASATNAKAAMNTANTAASSASTSATSASTSASNASKSEVAAKAAQAEAEKARDDANSAVTKLTGVMKYAGQVDDYSDLSDKTKNKGDVWNVVNADDAHGVKAGDNVVWNGTDWDNLSGYVDLSAFAQKDDYQKVITSATANGATITFNHKDGTTSTTTVNNVAFSASATYDGKGQKIDTTYEKIADASNVHTSLQNSINTKQDKLTFDTTPTAGSTNPVTSDGVKKALDNKLNKTGEGSSGTWGINITGNANTADLAKAVSWENVNGKPDNFVDTDSTQTITGAKTLTNKTSIITTDDSQSVVPLAVQAPNLSAGHGVYINLGKEGAMYNRYSFGFHYLGNNSPYNYFSFSSSGGPSYIFDCAGNATFPGKVTAPTFSGSLNGNADTATKATQDASGNVITTTYAKKSEIPSVPVKGVKISGSTSNLTPDTSGIVTIPAIPTKVSTFTNDSGYLTTHQDLSGYQTKLTFDSTPTANSSNPVTSAGIKAAIDAKTVDLSNYYTKTQVDSAISTAISAITDGDSKSY